MPVEGYDYTREQFTQLLARKFFPEKTDHESALLLEYLARHGEQFDRWRFSVRIGPGAPSDPTLSPASQRAWLLSTQRRIDFVGLVGDRATLVELKTRVGHAVMGQLLSDRVLWMSEYPDDPEPELVAVGRVAAETDIDILAAHGITVYLYETPSTE